MSGTWTVSTALPKNWVQGLGLRNFDGDDDLIHSGGRNNSTTFSDIYKILSNLTFAFRNFDTVTRFNHGGGATVSAISEWGGGENLSGTVHNSTVSHNDTTNVVTTGSNMLGARRSQNVGASNTKRLKLGGKNGVGSFLNTSEKNDSGTYATYVTAPESQCYDGAGGNATSDMASKGQPSSGTATNILRELVHSSLSIRNLSNDSVSRLRNTSHRSNANNDLTCFGGSTTSTGTPYSTVTEFTYSSNTWATSSNAPVALAEHDMADSKTQGATVTGGKTNLQNLTYYGFSLRNLNGK